jgi:hypothetical protein
VFIHVAPSVAPKADPRSEALVVGHNVYRERIRTISLGIRAFWGSHVP